MNASTHTEKKPLSPCEFVVEVSADAIVDTGCADGMLWALDAVSGNVIWKKKVGGLLIGDVWIDDGVAYVASEDGHLYCLETE